MNSKWIPRTIDIISIVYTVGYFALFILAFFKPFPDANEKVLTVLLGLLSAAQLRIVDSFFAKDASNSAVSTTIRAMNADPTAAALLDEGVVVQPAVVAIRKEVT